MNNRSDQIIRIGTRKSALALRQTELIAAELQRAWPGLSVELVTKDTLGDQILDRPLVDFGGKGVFISEFEQALLEGTMDLAVHSAKDLPMELSPGLSIAAVSHREDPRDVLVYCEKKHISGFPVRVGTSSPRRQLQAALLQERLWPGSRGLVCIPLRGNVQTRLRKLKEGECDVIILAAAGLKRLGILEEGNGFSYEFLPPDLFIPAGGQGILAVEAKTGSHAWRLAKALDHRESRLCFETERLVLQGLHAGCHEPVGVHCFSEGGSLFLRAVNSRENRIRQICKKGNISFEEGRRMAREAWNELT